VALLSRGVRGRRRDSVSVVSGGAGVRLEAAEVGDEPVWLARNTPGVPVLAGRDRAALGRHALAAFASEVLILDDGFQHHRLARDLDLVCVDAGFGLGNGHVLPRGPLREPATALSRADAVIFTRAQPGQGVPELPAPPGVPRFALEMAPARLRRLGTGEVFSLDSLRGEPVGLLAALARPGGLRQTLIGAGARIAAERLFADHHLYTDREQAQLSPDVRWITTGKDAVKLSADRLGARRVDVLEEEVRPARGEALVDWILDRLGWSPHGSEGSPVAPRVG
jgi:tetraacyldisaccharide 4'-kinase